MNVLPGGTETTLHHPIEMLYVPGPAPALASASGACTMHMVAWAPSSAGTAVERREQVAVGQGKGWTLQGGTCLHLPAVAQRGW